MVIFNINHFPATVSCTFRLVPSQGTGKNLLVLLISTTSTSTTTTCPINYISPFFICFSGQSESVYPIALQAITDADHHQSLLGKSKDYRERVTRLRLEGRQKIDLFSYNTCNMGTNADNRLWAHQAHSKRNCDLNGWMNQDR